MNYYFYMRTYRTFAVNAAFHGIVLTEHMRPVLSTVSVEQNGGGRQLWTILVYVSKENNGSFFKFGTK